MKLQSDVRDMRPVLCLFAGHLKDFHSRLCLRHTHTHTHFGGPECVRPTSSTASACSFTASARSSKSADFSRMYEASASKRTYSAQTGRTRTST
eukprot:921611-Amphidinium_carterae.1